MSEHRHAEVVPGCYRCELGKDELADALLGWCDEDCPEDCTADHPGEE